MGIRSLASDHPQSALALLTESSDLIDTAGMGRLLVPSSLAKWAEDDPVAAVAWMKANRAKFPALVKGESKRGLISGTAKNDPRLAFSMIGEMEIEEPCLVIRSINSAAKTPEERTATLAAPRDYQKALGGKPGQADVLGNGITTSPKGRPGRIPGGRQVAGKCQPERQRTRQWGKGNDLPASPKLAAHPANEGDIAVPRSAKV